MSSVLQTRLLFSNDAQTPLGRLRLAGLIKQSSGVRGPSMRVLGSYALVYLLEGSGSYSDGLGHSSRVRAGDLLVLFPDVGHLYGPGSGEVWSEWYCVFDGPVFDLWRRAGLLDPDRPVVHLEPVAVWSARFEAAVSPPSPPTIEQRTEHVSRFVSVLTEALVAGRDAQLPASSWITRACERLGSDLHADLDLETVANEAGQSYETFRKRFRRAMGVAPGRFRLIRRIDAACALLQHTDLPARDIAGRVGFNDEFHFSRSFKRVTGVAPSRFRRQLPRAGHDEYSLA